MANHKPNMEVSTANNDTELTIDNIYSKKSSFDLALRMANAFAASSIVPKDYQGNPSNCLIALEMAGRIGTAPMMVMQNLYIVSGRPAWSSQFIIAMINNSRKYKTEIQYDIKGSGDDLECTAYAIDHNNRKVSGPTITMKMAKAEGWLGRNGSKWQTMPEVMIRYRAVSFFGRLNCPDLIMGIYSADEVIDLPENQYQFVASELPAHVVGSAPHTEETITGGAPEQTSEALLLDAPATEDVNKTTNDAGDTPPAGLSHDQDPNLFLCAECSAIVTQAELNYSVKKYSRPLCRTHQKEAAKIQ